MSENTTQTQLPATTEKAPLAFSSRGIQVDTFDGLWRLATCISQSGLAPKGIQTPQAILVAIQMGAEIGLPPMSALQNIAVINGRPSVWGDAQLGIVRASGQLEKFEEFYEFNGQKLTRNPVTIQDGHVAVCRVKRRGCEASEVGFSVQDAKAAGLWGKDGPWRQYPARMLRYRARAFALRDQFGDLLRGLYTAEELGDGADRMRAAIEAAAPVTISTATEQAGLHEARDGSQPTAESEVQPKAEVTPPATEATPQERLAAQVIDAGHDFDAFVRAAIHLKFMAPADVDKWTTFADLDGRSCNRWLRAFPQILTAMEDDAGTPKDLL